MTTSLNEDAKRIERLVLMRSSLGCGEDDDRETSRETTASLRSTENADQ